ncbi:low molecular weight phosphotyrosine protein phosphatase-like protein [Delitschia confertaspora ATCC 74209]|uniref:Low molecular weight phosphotyrosine protein phosphatase-like protein n=1 Tax=Delitschia confertaspora ATCC 74209 TaxID=1513339 RepID=A0A9P4JV92_9PLEO|nr:low molecular weight phosphotyrosine protein phosphatase-like protein [Delitschia confertaspora ATCC 74209]
MPTDQPSPSSLSNLTAKPVSVLFVCLGNICRSTMAEGVFRHITRPEGKPPHHLIAKIDSCGTGAYHVGDDPDPRTMSTLHDHGITTYTHSARKFRTKDFEEFDYILAMDDDNLEDLERLRKRVVKEKGGEESVGRVCLFGQFGGKRRRGGRGEEVQDPYYGARDGFEVAYEQSVRFSKAFLGMLERGEL